MASPKNLWRKNFSIKRCHYQMATPAMLDALIMQEKTIGENIIDEVLWLQQDVNLLGAYFEVNQLRALIDKAMDVFQNHPEKIEATHQEAREWNQKLFDYVCEISTKDFSKMSSEELIKIYEKCVELLMQGHGTAVVTTWFIDSDGEDLSKFLISKTKEIVEARKPELNFAEVFSTLTTPAEESFAIKEEIESLKILDEIKEDKEGSEIFKQDDINKIEEDLVKITPELRNKIISHFEKWQWTPFTYMGPAYTLAYYLQIWSGLLKENINIGAHLGKLENYTKNIKAEKDKLIQELKLTGEEKRWYDIASEIIFLKAFRKDCSFRVLFTWEKIMKEVAKRLSLFLKQAWFLAYWEVAPALRAGGFDADILNARMKFSILHQKGKKGIIYIGKEAQEFLANYNLEQTKIEQVDRLVGTCACPGKVKGVVKVINLSEEMGKMEEGNIMVAHTTFPSLVPAMKKASAIITDDGGITCHAAIVARELKIPCVVGTKIITDVVKDGDEVEVDAGKGVVKIIKN